jgi:hypothetical protein
VALLFTCVPPTAVTQGHEAGHEGEKCVPLRVIEPVDMQYRKSMDNSERKGRKLTIIINTISLLRARNAYISRRIQNSHTHQTKLRKFIALALFVKFRICDLFHRLRRRDDVWSFDSATRMVVEPPRERVGELRVKCEVVTPIRGAV